LTDARLSNEARRTALIVAAVLALFAAWRWYRGSMRTAAVLCSAAAVLAIVGLAAPRAAVIFHRWWMQLAAVLGFINTRILLGLMFWGILTPMGAIMRLLGRDVLLRRGRRETYWVARSAARQARTGFERAF
jgi:hypothetical protein